MRRTRKDNSPTVFNQMIDQGFQILSRTELDAELANLFRRWDASPEQRAEFVSWAWVVAAAADLAATDSPSDAATLLRTERDKTHAMLAERLHQTSSVDLFLVSKRMFLDWLAGELASARAAA
jgi:hypothetical protein